MFASQEAKIAAEVERQLEPQLNALRKEFNAEIKRQVGELKEHLYRITRAQGNVLKPIVTKQLKNATKQKGKS